MEFKFQHALFLLIISKVPEWKASFNVNRLLVRFYGIIEIMELSKELENAGLIDVTLINALTYFTLTAAGREYLDNVKDKFVPMLFDLYPDQLKFSKDLVRVGYEEEEN